MNINDLFEIRQEKNSEYISKYSDEIKITSYMHKRNNIEWKKTVDYCSTSLYQDLNKNFSGQKIYFWVQYRFIKEPTRLELYKGLLNDKGLNFLSNRKIPNIWIHNSGSDIGCSSLMEITDKELFSSALNYLRDSNEGFLFMISEIPDEESFDKEIYSIYKGFSSIVNYLINKNYILLRPFGSFDDSTFCIEIFEKNIL